MEALVLAVVVEAVGLLYSVGVHSVPPFSVGRVPRLSAPEGPLPVVMGAKRPRLMLLSVRAAATAVGGFSLLTVLVHVADEHPAIHADMGAQTLAGEGETIG